MELWLDTIDFDTVAHASRLNVLTGVTTNPSILGKATSDPESILRKLLDIQSGYVAVQIVATGLPRIIEQAQRIAQIDDRIIIKIPAAHDGFEAIAWLEKKGIRTLATTIFDTRQILLAAMLGATYAAPYLSKIDQSGGNADAVIDEGNAIIKANRYTTKIMVASIKTVEQFVQCAKIGAAAVTLPGQVYRELFCSTPQIEESMSLFDGVWNSNHLTRHSELFKRVLANGDSASDAN